ncbi:unnamed protein product [Prorocentrum cordatum]|uniref:Uncharacterized protein n=1 Tax=Prorocentrum cordatum TaxID=2364126 RepID=A0ABN9UGM2_9DINO|nr:unnamed protein product [Polarella glacialis]
MAEDGPPPGAPPQQQSFYSGFFAQAVAPRPRPAERPASRPRPAEETRHAQLNRLLTASRGAREVLAVCAQHSAEFDLVNTVTAVHRVAKAPDGRAVCSDGEFVRAVRQLREQIGDFSPQHCSNTAWAVASLAFSDAPLTAALASESLKRISQFDA